MESIHLIRRNLALSETIVLARIEQMREHCMTPPTPNGGCHTLWVLGHLAYIESLIVRTFMFGESNPLAHWEEVFDGADVAQESERFPSFDEVLDTCRATRSRTVTIVDTFDEQDLHRPSSRSPAGVEELFGTYRRCLQYASDHWYMHRGHLADARRAAGLGRMWY